MAPYTILIAALLMQTCIPCHAIFFGSHHSAAYLQYLRWAKENKDRLGLCNMFLVGNRLSQHWHGLLGCGNGEDDPLHHETVQVKDLEKIYQVFHDPKNYHAAQADCQARGGQLADLSFDYKLNLFRKAAVGSTIETLPASSEVWITGKSNTPVDNLIHNQDEDVSGSFCRVLSNKVLNPPGEKFNVYAKTCSPNKQYLCEFNAEEGTGATYVDNLRKYSKEFLEDYRIRDLSMLFFEFPTSPPPYDFDITAHQTVVALKLGKIYQVFHGMKTQAQAETDCRRRGGQLAIFSSNNKMDLYK